MAATQASIKVVKSSSYRGVTHLWSNRYYLNNTSIDTQAHFNTLSDAIVTAEKAVFTSRETIVQTAYYAPGSDVAVWTRSYSTVGTLTSSGQRTPLDCVALVRYTTAQRTSKNHPLYLFNYYHGAYNQAAASSDLVAADQLAALGTYANAWVAGFSDGVTTYKKAGPRGAVATGYVAEICVTHRDFPR